MDSDTKTIIGALILIAAYFIFLLVVTWLDLQLLKMTPPLSWAFVYLITAYVVIFILATMYLLIILAIVLISVSKLK